MSELMERLRAKRARVVGPGAPDDWYYAMNLADDKSHFVYRIYDADGELLYIGCTFHLDVRINQHYDGAAFNTRMAYWTAWRYPNRSAARRAEANAIRAEEPEFNVHHNYRRAYREWLAADQEPASTHPAAALHTPSPQESPCPTS